ncbi:MAG: hypothetical protein HXX81_01515 [Campylobacterales bacterium]|nr:hypothetical protein [Campylobacterales bacterium]
MKFYEATIDIVFDVYEEDKDVEFKKEYNTFSQTNDDVVGQWLRNAKARGETKDSDMVLLTLLVELHRKVDTLTKIVNNEIKKRLELSFSTTICGINFDGFEIEEALFEKDKTYYCRVALPVFPQRDIAIFVKAISNNGAKISLMHESDEKDWNGYVRARERAMIRELKAKA